MSETVHEVALLQGFILVECRRFYFKPLIEVPYALRTNVRLANLLMSTVVFYLSPILDFISKFCAKLRDAYKPWSLKSYNGIGVARCRTLCYSSNLAGRSNVPTMGRPDDPIAVINGYTISSPTLLSLS